MISNDDDLKGGVYILTYQPEDFCTKDYDWLEVTF